jgi:predicted nucleotidyltransferase
MHLEHVLARMLAVARSVPGFLRAPLEAFAARLRARFGDRLRELRLFGSYARGEAHEDSDIDVLVLIDDLTDAEWGTVFDDLTPVLIETGLPIAPLVMSTQRLESLRQAERLLARDLDQEGITL